MNHDRAQIAALGARMQVPPCTPTQQAQNCPPPGGDIGQAVKWMRQGLKVRRAGWNGKGMWIVFMDELKLPPYSDQTTTRKVNDRTAKHIGEDTPFHSLPYIAMWTAQGQWLPGWLCSQTDLLANDWEVAP